MIMKETVRALIGLTEFKWNLPDELCPRVLKELAEGTLEPIAIVFAQ